MFSQACVKNSAHGGLYTPAPGQTPPGQTAPPRADTPPPQGRRLLQRTVRILLKCILFKNLFCAGQKRRERKTISLNITLQILNLNKEEEFVF